MQIFVWKFEAGAPAICCDRLGTPSFTMMLGWDLSHHPKRKVEHSFETVANTPPKWISGLLEASCVLKLSREMMEVPSEKHLKMQICFWQKNSKM